MSRPVILRPKAASQWQGKNHGENPNKILHCPQKNKPYQTIEKPYENIPRETLPQKQHATKHKDKLKHLNLVCQFHFPVLVIRFSLLRNLGKKIIPTPSGKKKKKTTTDEHAPDLASALRQHPSSRQAAGPAAHHKDGLRDVLGGRFGELFFFFNYFFFGRMVFLGSWKSFCFLEVFESWTIFFSQSFFFFWGGEGVFWLRLERGVFFFLIVLMSRSKIWATHDELQQPKVAVARKQTLLAKWN